MVSAVATSSSAWPRGAGPVASAEGDAVHGYGLRGWIPYVALALLAALIIPRLPPGVCFDDSGDLQAASRTLSLAHAPGYAGYVTLGWLITRIPGVDPAWLITLVGCLAGLMALGLGARIQMMFGVDPSCAAAVMLLLALHPAVRDNLWLAEVYAPTAALLLGAVLLILAARRTSRLAYIYAAALLLGVIAGSRTSAVLMLPGFGLAIWRTCRRCAAGKQWRPLLVAGVCAAAPVAYCVVFAGLRTPVPAGLESTGGAAGGGILQILRTLSGADYGLRWSTTWAAAVERADWALRHGTAPQPYWLCVTVLPFVGLLAGVGFYRILRAASEVAWALAGIGGGALALLVLVHTDEVATDYLPLVLVLGVCCGVGLFGQVTVQRFRQILVTRHVIFAGALICAVLRYVDRPAIVDERDATRFLADLDLASFSPHAVIGAQYAEWTALRSARIDSGRDDVTLVRVVPEDASRRVGALLDAASASARPLFVTRDWSVAGGRLSAWRNIHRVDRDSAGRASSAPATE